MSKVQLPESAVAPPVAMTQLTATIPPSGRTSPTGKPRGFVDPAQSSATPTDSTTTVEPAGDTAHDCHALDGECDSHMDDNGVTIHHGPEFTFPVDHETALPPFQLTQYGDEEPHIVVGLNAIEVGVDAAAALIRQVDQYALRLAETRKHLLAAVQQHRLDHGTPLAVVRAGWERVRLDHTPGKPAGRFAYSPAGLMRPISAVEYNRDTTTPEELQAYLDQMIGPDRVEYTAEVADALAGFEAIRRTDLDPKALEFWDEVEQQVIASGDPKGCVARIGELLAEETLASFIAEHDVQVFEEDLGCDRADAWGARINGRITLIFSPGQDPLKRLSTARQAVSRLVLDDTAEPPKSSDAR